jgi:Malectin domain
LAVKFADKGGIYENCNGPIVETAQFPLLCKHHTFNGPTATVGSYNIPLPPGTYAVRLFFAEVYFIEAGKRSFKFGVQGVTIKATFDVEAEVGANKAYVLSTIASIPQGTGTLNILLPTILRILWSVLLRLHLVLHHLHLELHQFRLELHQFQLQLHQFHLHRLSIQ